MKLDLNEVLTQIDGTSFETRPGVVATVGRTLAQILATDAKSPDPLRSYVLAMKINEAKDVELNDSDKDFIKESVKRHEAYYPIIKGRLLQLLEQKETAN